MLCVSFKVFQVWVVQDQALSSTDAGLNSTGGCPAERGSRTKHTSDVKSWKCHRKVGLVLQAHSRLQQLALGGCTSHSWVGCLGCG